MNLIYLVALDWDLDLGWSTSGRGGKWGRMKGFGLQPGPRGRSDQENFVILTNVNTNTNKQVHKCTNTFKISLGGEERGHLS